MPNMALTEKDVGALLEYFEVESRRVEEFQENTVAGSADQQDSGARKACCQKGKRAVLSKYETPAQTVSRGEGSETRQSGLIPDFSVQSAGLGCVFLLLAGVFRRRSSTSVEG